MGVNQKSVDVRRRIYVADQDVNAKAAQTYPLKHQWEGSVDEQVYGQSHDSSDSDESSDHSDSGDQSNSGRSHLDVKVFTDVGDFF